VLGSGWNAQHEKQALGALFNEVKEFFFRNLPNRSADNDNEIPQHCAATMDL